MKQNIFISATLHLMLATVVVLSFSVVMDRATLVAPDRIEIVEIDLNTVRVSGDETRLVNTDPAPAPKIPEPADPVAPDVAPEPTPAPSPAPDDVTPEPIPDAPALDEVPAPTPAAPTPAPDPEPAPVPDEKPVVDTPRPRKKTVVRVNREVKSLDRTMTVSVTDALRVALTRCWVIDTTRDDIADIRAVARLTMGRNGMVRNIWFESARRAETDPAFAYVLDTIRDALAACQPFRMLPPGEFEAWEKIQLTFYPTQGKIM